ncbi:porin [Thiomonas sp. FB-6]|uniref:porin n=1 Tax=Thiomonas sp. FB-6 TaxID=1158291 RepID=UPI0003829D38|nr:porin [Thiomonas sp. FB-6]
MKKSLIALAVFGAFSGAALADGSNVQLYGLIDLGVTHFTGGADGNVTQLSSGVQSGSRIGVKGTEDLGGGLSTIFDVETGFCANGNTGAAGSSAYCTGGPGGPGFMGRQAWVGLKGDFGTVQAGRQYTLSFGDQANIDPFGYGLTGSISNMGTVGVPARASQVIGYTSPNLSGFTIAGQYMFGAGMQYLSTAEQYKTTGGYNLQAGYANGPIGVTLSFLRVNDASGNAYVKDTELSGSYNFGVAKVVGYYSDNKPDTAATGKDNLKAYMLGVTVPVGPGSILASYTHLKNDSVNNAGAKQYAVGYTYSLSKQTNLYASYAHISNDSVATYAVGDSTDGGFAPTAGGSSSGLGFGIRHQF